MPTPVALPSENLMGIGIARAGVGRAATFRAGFAPKDTTSDGACVWAQTEGPEVIDPAITWTETES